MFNFRKKRNGFNKAEIDKVVKMYELRSEAKAIASRRLLKAGHIAMRIVGS